MYSDNSVPLMLNVTTMQVTVSHNIVEECIVYDCYI